MIAPRIRSKSMHHFFAFKIKSLLLITFTVLLCGCATVPTAGSGKTYLKDICEQYDIQWQIDGVSQVIYLTHQSSAAKVLIGSEIVHLKGNQIYLSEPLRRESAGIVVPVDFKWKVIDPLISSGSIVSRREIVVTPLTIVVDAGHGGKDPGAIGGSGIQEKEVNLDIAKRLERRLKDLGFKVVMTRTRDIFISLEERTEIASRAKADLFISVHANSNPSKSIQGLEVYTQRELTWEELKEDQRKHNHRLIMNSLSMARNPDLEKTLTDMLANYKETVSPLLAAYIGRGVTKTTSAENRGTKHAGFFVLRNNLIPSVLVEVGYLSNRYEEGLLRTGSYREQIAQGIAESVQEYATR